MARNRKASSPDNHEDVFSKYVNWRIADSTEEPELERTHCAFEALWEVFRRDEVAPHLGIEVDKIACTLMDYRTNGFGYAGIAPKWHPEKGYFEKNRSRLDKTGQWTIGEIEELRKELGITSHNHAASLSHLSYFTFPRRTIFAEMLELQHSWQSWLPVVYRIPYKADPANAPTAHRVVEVFERVLFPPESNLSQIGFFPVYAMGQFWAIVWWPYEEGTENEDKSAAIGFLQAQVETHMESFAFRNAYHRALDIAERQTDKGTGTSLDALVELLAAVWRPMLVRVTSRTLKHETACRLMLPETRDMPAAFDDFVASAGELRNESFDLARLKDVGRDGIAGVEKILAAFRQRAETEKEGCIDRPLRTQQLHPERGDDLSYLTFKFEDNDVEMVLLESRGVTKRHRDRFRAYVKHTWQRVQEIFRRWREYERVTVELEASQQAMFHLAHTVSFPLGLVGQRISDALDCIPTDARPFVASDLFLELGSARNNLSQAERIVALLSKKNDVIIACERQCKEYNRILAVLPDRNPTSGMELPLVWGFFRSMLKLFFPELSMGHGEQYRVAAHRLGCVCESEEALSHFLENDLESVTADLSLLTTCLDRFLGHAAAPLQLRLSIDSDAMRTLKHPIFCERRRDGLQRPLATPSALYCDGVAEVFEEIFSNAMSAIGAAGDSDLAGDVVWKIAASWRKRQDDRNCGMIVVVRNPYSKDVESGCGHGIPSMQREVRNWFGGDARSEPARSGESGKWESTVELSWSCDDEEIQDNLDRG